MNLKESFNILQRRFEQKNLLFVSGNVYDKYQTYKDGAPQRELTSLPMIIKEMAIINGYDNVEYFRHEKGLIDLMDEKVEDPSLSINDFLLGVANNMETLACSKVYILDLADSLFSSKNNEVLLDEVLRIFSAMTIKPNEKAIEITDIKNNSKLVLIMRDSGNVIQDWSNKNNEYGHALISRPDRNEISDLLSIFAKSIGSNDSSELQNKDSDTHKEALTLTTGSSYKEILQLARISENDISFKELYNLSRFSKTQSEWEKLSFDEVKNIKSKLEESVKGQDYAIDNVSRVLKNSLLGLNGALNGENSKKPKGILFFAGPTGVGKTEMAKAITTFVFGDESRMIRFDMSEFSQENADQRLIGAPPGFVGYDSGGELTNAVMEEPQSIILFDEIEKANLSILDKFLQILEDGRLTSSKGELIDFSETFIVFTSNIGADKADPEKSIEENIKSFKKAVENKFIKDIKKPEILNRIGIHNVIPFNFIVDPKILFEIFNSKFKKLQSSLFDKHNIKIQYDENDFKAIFDIVEKKYDKLNGGRGLIAAIEQTIQYKLVNFLFDNPSLLQEEEKMKVIKMENLKQEIVFKVL